MKKQLISIILALVLLPIGNSFAWTQRAPQPLQSCAVHAPYGMPQVSAQPICREGYLVAYDAAAKIPKFVTYTLPPQNAVGCFPRTNAFVADESVLNGPTPQDYVGTGYDKGHASPDGDQSWSQQVEYESFLMTNMYPQAGSLNRGIWKLLETSIRGWALQRNQAYTIYVGGIYGVGDKIIGNGVVVPHGFYKIVINQATGEVAGWGFPHTPPYPNLGNDLTKYRIPVNQIKQLAKINFKFPEHPLNDISINSIKNGAKAYKHLMIQFADTMFSKSKLDIFSTD